MASTPDSCCPREAYPYLAADRDKDDGIIGDADGVSYYQIGSSEVGILVISDVWGWNSGRVRAIADYISKEKGVSLWIPKILAPFEGGTSGDGLPPDFNMMERRSELFPLFAGDWNPKVVVPMCHKVIEKMKLAGVNKMGCLGFCYGGWLCFHLSKEVDFVCGASPHPSVHIEGLVGGDPGALAAEVRCPFALFPCGVASEGGDPDMYDPQGAVFTSLEAKFPGQNVTERYSTVKHGFTTRGDLGDEAVKRTVPECINKILEFFAGKGLIPTP